MYLEEPCPGCTYLTYSVSFSKKSEVRSTIFGGLFILNERGASIKYFFFKSIGFFYKLMLRFEELSLMLSG